MTNWITGISENEWKSKTASGLIANQEAARAAEKVGFKVLSYPRYNSHQMREEGWQGRQTRIEGLVAGVKPGDTVIFQYPTWVNNNNFDGQFIDTIRNIPNVKIAAYVWDIISWVHDDRERDYSGDISLWFLSKFNLVMAANPKIAKRLRTLGGVKCPIMPLGVTDILYSNTLKERKFLKRLYFTATGINPTMVEDYKAKTDFYFIGPDWAMKEENGEYKPHPDNFHFLGQKFTDEIPAIYEGGFGVVAYGRGGVYPGMVKYGEYNNPMKLSQYIASGLPPIVRSNSAHAGWVKEQNIGLVIDDLNEIDEILDKMTEADYRQILENL
ncbi:MAG: beta-1,6-galactofuranosyltransferase, partial [Streptococcaceae bacterium]|nr:beta-1,6-galactofuranosyltransferase [Streptococcaceae bacterium]